MSHRTTSERGSRTCRRQTHDTSWPPVPEVPAEHRPRREPAAVRMQFVAACPALLEARDELVDETLGVAQLGRGHPVELAVAKHLAVRISIRSDDDALDVVARLVLVVAGGHRDPALVGPGRRRSSPGVGLGLPVGSSSASTSFSSGRCSGGAWKSPCRRRPRAATSGRTRCRTSARSSRRRTKIASPAARTCSRSDPCRRAAGRAHSRPRRRGRCAARPRGAPARTRPPR